MCDIGNVKEDRSFDSESRGDASTAPADRDLGACAR